MSEKFRKQSGEENPQMEIVGGTEEEKNDALKELQILFDEKNEKLSGHELEKTPEDVAIIQKTESIVDKIVKKYGGKPKAVPLDHIYILKPNSVLTMTDGRLSMGVHMPLSLKIGVEKEESNLLFAAVMAHEMFHLKSYKSARIGKTAQDVRLYRSGISMIDKKDPGAERGNEKQYFAIFEEAIVAECGKKFLDEIGKEDLFKKDTEAIKKFKDLIMAYHARMGMPEEKVKMMRKELRYIPNPQEKIKQIFTEYKNEEDRQAYVAGILEGLYKAGKLRKLERYKERKMLYKVLDEIVEKSEGKFKNRDSIFDEFAKANFSGNYLPLARIIEGILGRGSFRKLAEEFRN